MASNVAVFILALGASCITTSCSDPSGAVSVAPDLPAEIKAEVAQPTAKPVQLSLGTQTGGSGGARACGTAVWEETQGPLPQAGHYEGDVLLMDWQLECRLGCVVTDCATCESDCRQAAPPAGMVRHAVLEVVSAGAVLRNLAEDCTDQRRATVSWTLSVDDTIATSGTGDLNWEHYFADAPEDQGGGGAWAKANIEALGTFEPKTIEEIAQLLGPARSPKATDSALAPVTMSLFFGALGEALVEVNYVINECNLDVSLPLARGVLRSEQAQTPVIDETPTVAWPPEHCTIHDPIPATPLCTPPDSLPNSSQAPVPPHDAGAGDAG